MKVIWMTGLSGAGKTTLATRLVSLIEKSILIDGDVMRSGLCSDLGFDFDSRRENIRRLAHISKFLFDKGFSPIVPVICPTEELRNLAKEIIGVDNFFLVYIQCDLDTCKRRDVKGLYAKVTKGEIENFTGIDSTFEEPTKPDIIINTSVYSVEDCLREVLKSLI